MGVHNFFSLCVHCSKPKSHCGSLVRSQSCYSSYIISGRSLDWNGMWTVRCQLITTVGMIVLTVLVHGMASCRSWLEEGSTRECAKLSKNSSLERERSVSGTRMCWVCSVHEVNFRKALVEGGASLRPLVATPPSQMQWTRQLHHHQPRSKFTLQLSVQRRLHGK